METLFLTMLSDLEIPVFFEHRLQKVERDGDRITKVVFENGNAAHAKIFLETTYEGDLLARAGSTMWRVVNPTMSLVRSSLASK